MVKVFLAHLAICVLGAMLTIAAARRRRLHRRLEPQFDFSRLTDPRGTVNLHGSPIGDRMRVARTPARSRLNQDLEDEF